jgi:hypothetical protein
MNEDNFFKIQTDQERTIAFCNSSKSFEMKLLYSDAFESKKSS